MLIAALFIIAQDWKQPKCSSGSKQLNYYIHTMKYYYSTIRMEQNTAIQTKMVHNIWLYVILKQAKQISHDGKQISGCPGAGIDCKLCRT